MKIYEIREYIDGGPNDRGFLTGYVKARSKEHARKKVNMKSGFVQIHEISSERYRERKGAALRQAAMYKY